MQLNGLLNLYKISHLILIDVTITKTTFFFIKSVIEAILKIKEFLRILNSMYLMRGGNKNLLSVM